MNNLLKKGLKAGFITSLITLSFIVLMPSGSELLVSNFIPLTDIPYEH